jgi:hypothetical protein
LSTDEQRLWAELCAQFERLRDEAAEFGFRKEFEHLLARTRQEQVPVWAWQELLDEIAEQVSQEADYSGRGDRQAYLTVGSRPEYPASRFSCPVGLCGSYAVGSALTGRPRCLLMDKDMPPMP